MCYIPNLDLQTILHTVATVSSESPQIWTCHPSAYSPLEGLHLPQDEI